MEIRDAGYVEDGAPEGHLGTTSGTPMSSRLKE